MGWELASLGFSLQGRQFGLSDRAWGLGSGNALGQEFASRALGGRRFHCSLLNACLIAFFSVSFSASFSISSHPGRFCANLARTPAGRCSSFVNLLHDSAGCVLHLRHHSVRLFRDVIQSLCMPDLGVAGGLGGLGFLLFLGLFLKIHVTQWKCSEFHPTKRGLGFRGGLKL